MREPSAERCDRKKAVTPAVKRELVAGLRTEQGLSERRAGAAVSLRRSVYRYRRRPNRDGDIIKLLLELAHRRPEEGFPKLFKRLRRQGQRWNHKRVQRGYCSLKLNKRRKGQRRLPPRNPTPLAVPEALNECWSADFMSDALWGPSFSELQRGRRLQSRSVGDRSRLQLAGAARGALRLDNGPEFIALALAEWAEQHGVTLEFIKPGKPRQNGFIERFNRSYRQAVLDMFGFQTLNEVREQTELWLQEYNEERPHDALGDMTPREFLLTRNPEVSTYGWS